MQKKPQFFFTTMDHPHWLRPYLWGGSTVLDLFGSSAPSMTYGTVAEDGRCLGAAFREVGQDFRKVLSEELPRARN